MEQQWHVSLSHLYRSVYSGRAHQQPGTSLSAPDQHCLLYQIQIHRWLHYGGKLNKAPSQHHKWDIGFYLSKSGKTLIYSLKECWKPSLHVLLWWGSWTRALPFVYADISRACSYTWLDVLLLLIFPIIHFLHPLIVFWFSLPPLCSFPFHLLFSSPALSSFPVSVYVFPPIHSATGTGLLRPPVPHSCPLTYLYHPLVTHSQFFPITVLWQNGHKRVQILFHIQNLT